MTQPADDVAPAPYVVLIGRMSALALVGLVGAAGFALLMQVNRTMDVRVLRLAMASGLGLLVGLAARRGLRDHTRLLRALAAPAALLLSLIFLGVLSHGLAGIRLDLRQGSAGPDWAGLSQFALGLVSSLLALGAWRVAPLAATSGTAAASDARPMPAPAIQRPAWPTPPARVRSRAHTRAASNSTGVGVRRRVRSLLRLPSVRSPVARVSQRLRRWRHRVRIVGAEEDRCPYCLDVVERNDPRGVVTCPVCHTRHHADCWAVTGMCQVPHYHR